MPAASTCLAGGIQPMEIHTPEGPILSGKHLFVQLATITMGILIALSLEGLTGWFHHRALVREARANIESEIADNKKELDGVLGKVPESEQNLKQALGLVTDLLTRKTTNIHSLTLSYVIAGLNATSRSTAEATGALGYMDYTEVKKYAAVYELQQQFLRLQDRLLEIWIPLLNATQEGDPAQANERELLEWRERILTCLSYLQTEASLGKSLSGEYAKVLAASH
jgi:hypothetical protein